MHLCVARLSSMLTASHARPSSAATKVVRVPCYGQKQPKTSCVHFYEISFREKCSLQKHSLIVRKTRASSAKMRPSLSIYGMANDVSNMSPQSDGNDCQPKSHNSSAKGGIREWLQKFIEGRSVQKQELAYNLKRYGAAGMLSYGLLNTFYYLVTFLFVWFYVAPSKGGLGFIPAVQRFVKVFAMVWAGSQVTKLIRAAGALTLAPLVDRGLNWYTDHFNFQSRGKAFGFIVVACIALAVSVFLIITTLWA